jgi:hypothetical protein
MDRSSFLARLIGPTFVAIALGMLINLSIYERMIAEALRPGILLYLSGLLSLLAGLAIINLHNKWHMDWRVIITMLGWLMTIGGIIRNHDRGSATGFERADIVYFDDDAFLGDFNKGDSMTNATYHTLTTDDFSVFQDF